MSIEDYPHIRYERGVLRLLDQTQLPQTVCFLELNSASDIARAIAELRVRGAPAIGIVAAYGLALEAHKCNGAAGEGESLLSELRSASDRLIAARPTAVNLSWAVRRMLARAQTDVEGGRTIDAIAAILEKEAQAIHNEDIAACKKIGAAGAGLFKSGEVRLLTHCNTGTLATGGYGTALGVVRSLWEQGRLGHVYVDETRPVLQGSRLTTWELEYDKIPYTLITDSMAAQCMQRKLVDGVVVGADRIARNGDVANKIGTYGLAVLAKMHGLPFVVAAPRSTFDPAVTHGNDIVIEERNPSEVTHFAGVPSAPAHAHAANPAFDITPAEFITAIVSEHGPLSPPFDRAIAALVAQHGALAEAAP